MIGKIIDASIQNLKEKLPATSSIKMQSNWISVKVLNWNIASHHKMIKRAKIQFKIIIPINWKELNRLAMPEFKMRNK